MSALREYRKKSPLNLNARLTLAEAMLEIARQNKLDDPLTELTATLLDDRNLQVQAIAEWAIALRVGHENNSQNIHWPREDLPDWLVRWSSVSLARPN